MDSLILVAAVFFPGHLVHFLPVNIKVSAFQSFFKSRDLGIRMEEYKMLRQEILEDHRVIAQYTGILYAAVAAILAFAVKEGDFLLYLVPYVVILPLFLAGEARMRSICGIAAYLYVFHEGEDFRWERRHHRLEVEKGHRRNWRGNFPYYLLAMISTALSEYQLLFSGCDRVTKIAVGLLVALGSLGAMLVMWRNTTNYVAERTRMITEWEQFKALEDQPAPRR